MKACFDKYRTSNGDFQFQRDDHKNNHLKSSNHIWIECFIGNLYIGNLYIGNRPLFIDIEIELYVV